MNKTELDLNKYKLKEHSLRQKQIVITGATDGIGRALAVSCAQQGAELLLIAKNEKKLNALIQELSQFSGAEHHSYTIDFSIAGM